MPDIYYLLEALGKELKEKESSIKVLREYIKTLEEENLMVKNELDRLKGSLQNYINDNLAALEEKKPAKCCGGARLCEREDQNDGKPVLD